MHEVNHQYSILLGGIGGDSHSVGLAILKQALITQGYRVFFLGTQNKLDDFLDLAFLVDVVMISNMDGHAKSYLQEFPEKLGLNRPKDVKWYLGGNLTIGEAFGFEKLFLDMGFNRVFVKFTDVVTVLEYLERDLLGVAPKPDMSAMWEESRLSLEHLSTSNLSDEIVDPDVFVKVRKDVLSHWGTGAQAANIETNAEFLGKQPSFSAFQAQVEEGQRSILIQPRCGVALVEDQIKLFKVFKSIGVPLVSYQVDSFTRNNNYPGAEEALRESHTLGESYLNGFPLINHGVMALRRTISEVGLPIQTRHSTRDPRLLAEISYAGGVTAFEGGPICYNIPYYRNYPLSESIPLWQYVDRLTGLYFDKFGIVLDREFFGVLTGTLVPPSVAIATCVIEAVLAAAQGVKCVSLGYAEQGNRNQDIAAIRTMRSFAERVMNNLGYNDIQINVIFNQYMAAFPQNPQKAEELIYNSSITAALSGATRVLTKTPVEAYKIPTMSDNLHGLNLTMRGVADAEHEEINESEVAAECAIIETEIQSIFDSVLHCGGGSLVKGVVKAFAKGYLDVPFSPSIYNRGEVSTARDMSGAVRFLSFGQLQIDRETKQFHEEKMSERRISEGLFNKKKDYLLVEKDVLRIARGQYDHWPLQR